MPDPLNLLTSISPQAVVDAFTSTEFILLNPNAEPIQNCHRACRGAGVEGGGSKRCKIESRTVQGIVDIRTKGLGIIERGRCTLDLTMYWDGCSVTAVVLPGTGSYSGLFSAIKYRVNIFSSGDIDGATGCAPCCDDCCCVIFAIIVSVTGIATASQLFTSTFRFCGNGNWDRLS
jgi:hypothetical protein